MKEKRKRSIGARNILLGFCFIFLLAVTARTQNAGQNFIIVPENDPYADSARFYLEYFQTQIAKILDHPLDTTVTVYLAKSEKEFLADIGGVAPPDWGAGLAMLEEAKIVIKSPKYLPIYKSFRELIGHELAHIMLYRAAGGRWLPRWMQEGFAMYESGEWRFGDDILVARAAWTGKLLPLYMLEELSTFKSVRVNLAYGESYLAMSRLMHRYDPFALADLLGQYRKSGDFYRSWKNIFGQDYVGWITGWLTSVSRQYHFFIFLTDNEMFWIVLALLFVLLFVWKKRQNARVKRRWEREERMHPPDDSYKQYYDGYYDEENKV